MKRILIGIILGLIFSLTSGTAALAAEAAEDSSFILFPFWWIILALVVLSGLVIIDVQILAFLARRKKTKVKVGDIDIYYEIHGKGEPLVLIPGLGGNISNFARIIPTLAENYRVIAMDNRGAGQTDKPDIPYTMEMMAEDVAGLLNFVRAEKAHIFGISMGGMIAQHFALEYPQRVTSLILGSTTPGGPNSVGFEETVNTVNPEQRKNLSPEEDARAIMSMVYTKKFINNNPELIEELVAQRVQNPPDPVGRERQFQAASAHDTFERLPEIEAPTLVIAGDEDTVVSPENSQILTSRIPNSKLEILKGVGHGFVTEASEDTSRIVLKFLTEINQETSPVEEKE
ncbi:MAG: alpha/beta hydrolase [Dehalococcoidales bacterium]